MTKGVADKETDRNQLSCERAGSLGLILLLARLTFTFLCVGTESSSS